jgi:PAS domain S-box-containing protein
MEHKETFDQQIETTQQRLKALLERAGASPEQRAAIAEALEALSTSLEELYAAGEELHQQNEELNAAQQMLEEERQKYHELFEFAPDGYLLTDAVGTIHEANQAAAELLHVSQDDLIGKPLAAYVARQDHEAFYLQLADLAQAGQTHAERVVDWEVRLRPRGTRLLPVSLAVAVARDSHGQTVGLRWQVRDITRRKQGEAALRRARDELEIRVQERTAELAQANAALQVEVAEHRRAAEEAESQARFPTENPNPILRLSREGALLYANEASASLLAEWGCAPGGLVPPFWRDQVAEVMTSQATKTVDVPCGERVYSFFVVPIGPAGYVNLYGRDITVRVRAEETVRYHADLIERVSDAIVSTDTQFRIVSWNHGAEEMYGWRADEVIDRSFAEVARTDFLAVSREQALRELFEGGSWRGEVIQYHKNGEAINVLVATSVIKDHLGNLAGVVTVNHDITELKRAESQREAALEALSASEKEFRALFELSAVGLAEADPTTGRYLRVNAKLCAIAGYPEPELLGMTYSQLTHPDDREADADRLQAALRGETAGWTSQKRYIRKDGEIIWVEVVGTIIRDAAGHLLRSMAVIQDVTERVRAEEERARLLAEVQRQAAELSATLAAMTDGVLVLDRAGNILRSNEAAGRLLGYTPGEAPGTETRVYRVQAGQELLPLEEPLIARVLHYGEIVCNLMMAVLPSPNAPLTWLSVGTAPILDSDGQEQGAVVSLSDVTQLRTVQQQLEEANMRLQYQNEELQAQAEELQAQAEELHAQADELEAQALNLAEERARLQAIIDSAPEAILVADERGQVVLANPAADCLFAAPGTGAAGLERYAQVPRYNQDHAPVDPQHLPLFRAAVHGETHRNMPVALLWPDGQWRDVLASAVPIRDERGRAYGAVSIYQDITERVRVESQRDAMLEQVKAALAEKEVLMREIYHRVKNNVQALIYLMDMQADYISDDYTLQLVRELQERARAMALVHEKLYQSQNLAQIDFGDYLHDLVDNLSRAFRDGRAIIWHINAESVLLGVDTAIPCGLIVTELLTNALKYAFPGSHPCLGRGETECEIWIDFRADGDHLTLIVGDNGVGLPPGIDRSTTNSLGLQLINVLAEHQLGGQIEVDTQAGTTFKITFTERRR